VPGTDRVEMRSVVNGAALLVYGDVHEAELSKATRTVGYSLLTVSDPASNIRRFAVRNEGVIDEGKLLSALNTVGGIGEVRIRKYSRRHTSGYYKRGGPSASNDGTLTDSIGSRSSPQPCTPLLPATAGPPRFVIPTRVPSGVLRIRTSPIPPTVFKALRSFPFVK